MCTVDVTACAYITAAGMSKRKPYQYSPHTWRGKEKEESKGVGWIKQGILKEG